MDFKILSPSAVNLLKENLNNLIEARNLMKKDYEKSKLNELSLQANEVIENNKEFMQYVRNQKKNIQKFNEITAVKVMKKKIE